MININTPLRLKLYAAFGLLLLLGISLNAMILWQIWPVEQQSRKLSTQYTQETRLLSQLNQVANQIAAKMNAYTADGLKEEWDQAKAAFSPLREELLNLQKLVGQSPELIESGALVKNLNDQVQPWSDLVDQTGSALRLRTSTSHGALSQGSTLISNLLILQQKALKSPIKTAEILTRLQLYIDVIQWNQAMQNGILYLQATGDDKLITKALAKEPSLKQSLQTLAANTNQDPSDQEMLGELKDAETDYLDSIETTLKAINSTLLLNQNLQTQEKLILAELTDATTAGQDRTTNKASEAMQTLVNARTLTWCGVGVMVVLALILSNLIIHIITKPLYLVTNSLRVAATDAEESALSLHESSQSLSTVIAQQAQSLEEITPALEEINGMTKNNAESALQAASLSKMAVGVANQGEKDVLAINTSVKKVENSAQELREAMGSIQQSASAISKIIKTIDEIAFQTNILALNASVEAARAGEAGLGFAVVADEVRNLAKRCTEAARETTLMIESSIQRSNRGHETSEQVSQGLLEIYLRTEKAKDRLTEIVDIAQKTNQAIQNIGEACREQRSGMENISTNLISLDQDIQHTSVQSESLAGAAEQLQNQTHVLGESLVSLDQLLEGSETRSQHQQPPRALNESGSN